VTGRVIGPVVVTSWVVVVVVTVVGGSATQPANKTGASADT